MSLLIAVAFCATLGASIANGFERIVDGTDSDIGKFPFLVSLRRPDNHAHTCGGNLISPFWILTSSACILRPTPVTPPTGPIEGIHTIQHSSTIISPTATANISEIAEIIIHPNFYPFLNNSYFHDVTLLRLIEPVFVSRYAILPTQFADIAHGTPAIIVGWGYNETNGVTQEHLQEANLIIFSDEECRNRHESIIHPSHICGGLPEGGSGACINDGGTPLLVNGLVVGFVSWIERPIDCGGILPTVFTQISYYREWIRQITGI